MVGYYVIKTAWAKLTNQFRSNGLCSNNLYLQPGGINVQNLSSSKSSQKMSYGGINDKYWTAILSIKTFSAHYLSFTGVASKLLYLK